MRFAEKDQLRELYHDFHISPEASILAGWIFEAIIHRLLIHGWWKPDGPVPQPRPMTSDGETPPTFTYTPPASPPSPTLPRPIRNKYRNAILIDFNAELDDITLEENRYYMPIGTNSPLFNSFTIDRNRGKTTVISFFQVTVSETCGGSAKGCPLIQKIMKRIKELLRKDNPKTTPKVSVAYFLVRPEDRNESRYIWEMPVGWDETKAKRKINNYCGDVFCLLVPTSGTLYLFTPSVAA